MKRNKILITGASGFVGKALVSSLKPSNVICLGRNHVQDTEFVYSDYSISESIIRKMEDVKTIVHCAGRAHVMNESEVESKKLYQQANVETTSNIASMAKKAGVSRFIYISSIKVNGNANNKPFLPEDEVRPADHYGQTKFEAEKKLIEISELCAMDYAIIRPPLIYGPGVKGNLEILSKFLERGMPNPFICINKNRRSMVSIYNLVSLIDSCIEFKGVLNKVFLVSDGHDISTADAVKMISNTIGSKNLPLPIPSYFWRLFGSLFNKQDYVERIVGNLQVDISKTTKFLKWNPKVTVLEGFQRSFSK